jgi:hypothetical protein
MMVRIKYPSNSGKIAIIVMVRRVTGMGLREAKDLVEQEVAFRASGGGALSAGSFKVKSLMSEACLTDLNRSDMRTVGLTIETDKPMSDGRSDDRKGNHAFSFPDHEFSRDFIQQLKDHTNSARFRVKVEQHDGWLGVKIQKKKGNTRN